MEKNRTYTQQQIDTMVGRLTQLYSDVKFSLKPSGSATSAQILGFTQDKGIYVATDNGNWYFWNGTSYQLGGAFQAGEIADNSIDIQKLSSNDIFTSALTSNKIIINGSNIITQLGIYKYENATINLDHSFDESGFRCVKLIKPTYIKYLQYTSTEAEVISWLDYVIVRNSETNEIKRFTERNRNLDACFDISNYDELYINFYGGTHQNEFYLFSDILSKEYLISPDTVPTFSKACGYDSSGNLIIIAYGNATHNATNEIKLNGASVKIEYEIYGTQELGVGVCYYKDRKGVGHELGSRAVGKHTASADDVDAIVFNLSKVGKTVNGTFPPEIKLSIYEKETKSSIETPKLFLYQNYNINAIKPQAGQVAHFFGDSITWGFTSGNTVTQNNYCKKLSDHFGWSFTNSAQGGAKFVEQVSESIKTMQQQMESDNDKSRVDYVFIAGGTNDCAVDVDLTTFKTAVNNSIDYALTNYPNAQIIYITPVNSWSLERTTDKLNLYRQVISQCVMLKNNERLSIIQGYNINLPNETNDEWYRNLVMADKTHPTELGYSIYARCLIDIIENRI